MMSSPMKEAFSVPTAILFDLDGTLVDSLPDIRTAVNKLLAEFCLPPLSLAAVRGGLGDGAAHLVKHCLQISGQAAGETLPDLVRRYALHYEAGVAIESKAFPGVEQALRWLHENGYPMGVCTNKSTKPAIALLEALGLSHFFAAIVGGDAVSARNPDGGHIAATLAAMGIAGRSAVMAG